MMLLFGIASDKCCIANDVCVIDWHKLVNEEEGGLVNARGNEWCRIGTARGQGDTLDSKLSLGSGM